MHDELVANANIAYNEVLPYVKLYQTLSGKYTTLLYAIHFASFLFFLLLTNTYVVNSIQPCYSQNPRWRPSLHPSLHLQIQPTHPCYIIPRPLLSH